MEIATVTRIAEYLISEKLMSVRTKDCSYDFVLLPTGSKDKQMLQVNNYISYTFELYVRERKNEESEWGSWGLYRTIGIQ